MIARMALYHSKVISHNGWWFVMFSLFSHPLGTIIPNDFHIFQRGGPTTNQVSYNLIFRTQSHLRLYIAIDNHLYRSRAFTWGTVEMNIFGIAMGLFRSMYGFKIWTFKILKAG